MSHKETIRRQVHARRATLRTWLERVREQQQQQSAELRAKLAELRQQLQSEDSERRKTSTADSVQRRQHQEQMTTQQREQRAAQRRLIIEQERARRLRAAQTRRERQASVKLIRDNVRAKLDLDIEVLTGMFSASRVNRLAHIATVLGTDDPQDMTVEVGYIASSLSDLTAPPEEPMPNMGHGSKSESAGSSTPRRRKSSTTNQE